MNIFSGVYSKINDSNNSYHLAIKNYHNPDKFISGVNLMIQSLRNITFTLQKQKNLLPDFDVWYQDWQEKMRSDIVLKEISEARNVIVKEGDLKLKSKGNFKVLNWFKIKEFSFEFNPLISPLELSVLAAKTTSDYFKNKPDFILDRMIFEVEIDWIYNKLPDKNLLEHLVYVYNFMINLVKDAEEKFSINDKINPYICNSCDNCMKDLDFIKKKFISLSDENSILNVSTERINRNDHIQRLAKKDMHPQ